MYDPEVAGLVDRRRYGSVHCRGGGNDRVDGSAPAYVAFTRRTVRTSDKDGFEPTHLGEAAWQSRRVALYTIRTGELISGHL